jgi:hypothetical protein
MVAAHHADADHAHAQRTIRVFLRGLHHIRKNPPVPTVVSSTVRALGTPPGTNREHVLIPLVT